MGMLGRGMGKKDSFLIPLPFIPLPDLPGATKHAHPAILAQKPEIPHLMAGSFFATRFPCKY
jgi:hypothetical protein